MNHDYRPTSAMLRSLFVSMAVAITFVLGAFIDQLAEHYGPIPVAAWHQSSDGNA